MAHGSQTDMTCTQRVAIAVQWPLKLQPRIYTGRREKKPDHRPLLAKNVPDISQGSVATRLSMVGSLMAVPLQIYCRVDVKGIVKIDQYSAVLRARIQ